MDFSLSQLVDQILHDVDAKVDAEQADSGFRIDGYEMVSILGEGGFGTVWLARQTAPVKREVAVKILKTGHDSREVLARFDQERQALAQSVQAQKQQIEAAAKAAGLAYRHLPVSPAHQTPEEALAMAQLLRELPRPLLMFCRSGGRSSRLYRLATEA